MRACAVFTYVHTQAFLGQQSVFDRGSQTQTHTYIYIFIYVYMYMCKCMYTGVCGAIEGLGFLAVLVGYTHTHTHTLMYKHVHV